MDRNDRTLEGWRAEAFEMLRRWKDEQERSTTAKARIRELETQVEGLTVEKDKAVAKVARVWHLISNYHDNEDPAYTLAAKVNDLLDADAPLEVVRVTVVGNSGMILEVRVPDNISQYRYGDTILLVKETP